MNARNAMVSGIVQTHFLSYQWIFSGLLLHCNNYYTCTVHVVRHQWKHSTLYSLGHVNTCCALLWIEDLLQIKEKYWQKLMPFHIADSPLKFQEIYAITIGPL